MSKLLLFIGQNVQFDEEQTIAAIESIDGVINARRGNFIGAVFECEYHQGSESTIVRITDDRETVTVDGTGDISLEFALKLKSALSHALTAVDLDYSFHIDLTQIQSPRQFRERIATGSKLPPGRADT